MQEREFKLKNDQIPQNHQWLFSALAPPSPGSGFSQLSSFACSPVVAAKQRGELL